MANKATWGPKGPPKTKGHDNDATWGPKGPPWKTKK